MPTKRMILNVINLIPGPTSPISPRSIHESQWLASPSSNQPKAIVKQSQSMKLALLMVTRWSRKKQRANKMMFKIVPKNRISLVINLDTLFC